MRTRAAERARKVATVIRHDEGVYAACIRVRRAASETGHAVDNGLLWWWHM